MRYTIRIKVHVLHADVQIQKTCSFFLLEVFLLHIKLSTIKVKAKKYVVLSL